MSKKKEIAISGGRISTAETQKLKLWLFSCQAIDRRTGTAVDGEAVEIGDDANDIDAATERIRQKYSTLGYELTDAKYEAQKIAAFSTKALFYTLDDSAEAALKELSGEGDNAK